MRKGKTKNKTKAKSKHALVLEAAVVVQGRTQR